MSQIEQAIATQVEVEQVVPVKMGLLDKIKESFNPEAISKKFNLNRSTLMEMGVYLGVGFVSGFLFKKFSKYVFVFALGVAGIFVLQQLGVVSIVVDWNKMHELFGIRSVTMPDASIFGVYWNWIKVNAKLVLSFSGGFLVGLKVG